LVLLVVIVVSSFLGAYQAQASSSPIKHVVIIMMENQTFDHFFGTFPNVTAPYSLPLDSCQQTTKHQQHKLDYPKCIYPFNADSFAETMQEQGLSHSRQTEVEDYNNGSMNMFVKSQNSKYANESMSYITGATIPDYWDYASYYALDANFFSSTLSYSWPNHLYLLTDTDPQQCVTISCRPMFNLTLPNIVEAMNTTGVDWKYYQADWNDSSQCVAVKGDQKLPSQISYYTVPVDWPSIQDGQSTCHRIQNTQDLYNGLNTSGYLPQVAWVVPDHNESDHAGCNDNPNGSDCLKPKSPLYAGQEFVSNIINKIASNATLWDSTAVFLTWDDPGGYHDNVSPNQVDQFGYGFRAPLIVISPYVKTGIYYGPSGQQQDFTAFLATIEHLFNLPPIGGRDASVEDLWYMFDFAQEPLTPLILPSNVLAIYPLSTCATCGYGSTAMPYVSSHPLPNNDLPANDSTGCTPVDSEGDPCD
jgi:phospholipase C